MTVTSSSVQSISHRVDANEPPAVPSLSVIDFATARDCLLAQNDKSITVFEIEQELRKVAALRKSSAELSDPVEDWLYWLISAAVLVSLLLGILYLSDFTMGRTQSIGIKLSGQAERDLSGDGNPDSSGKSLSTRPSRSTPLQNISQPSE